MAEGWLRRIKNLWNAGEPQTINSPAAATAGVPEAAETTTAAAPNPPPETTAAAVLDSERTQVEPLRYEWHGLTDTGMVRPQNEDSFSGIVLGKWSLFAVADGMGGHDAGEVASRIAVETVCREIGEGMRENHQTLLSLIQHAVQRANSAVNKEGTSRRSNMGTTLCLALVNDNTAYVANVGDSRAYWIENGALTQITRDHSLVAQLVAAGELTKEEARNHPRSNVLYHTIGNTENIEVDTFQVNLKRGGTLLLCTDGLWGEMSDEDINRIVSSGADARTAAENLVQAAKANGGKDNITTVAIRVL